MHLAISEIETADGRAERVLAKAVIDASGTYTQLNPLGANGRPVLGEQMFADRIFYGIPDLLGSAHSRYAGKRVLVAGSGQGYVKVLEPSGILLLENIEAVEDTRWIPPSIAR
jgi:hypothetical protein